MGSNFSKVKIGSLFNTSDGETYKKTSELTFDDMAGIEHYIDPFMDKKIGAAPGTEAPTVDTSARIVKGSEEAPKTKAAKKPRKSTKKSN